MVFLGVLEDSCGQRCVVRSKEVGMGMVIEFVMVVEIVLKNQVV
jgi:hypothetical protein